MRRLEAARSGSKRLEAAQLDRRHRNAREPNRVRAERERKRESESESEREREREQERKGVRMIERHAC